MAGFKTSHFCINLPWLMSSPAPIVSGLMKYYQFILRSFSTPVSFQLLDDAEERTASQTF
jgi:hypothetical protein